MRCRCKKCPTYMVQAESEHLGCVCPECGYRCTDCLGTNTVVQKDQLSRLAFDPRFSPEALARAFLLPSSRIRYTAGISLAISLRR